LNAPFCALPAEVAAAHLARAVPALSGRPYLLHVGSGLRRKNREGVLRIFARLREEWPEGRLVFAGEALSDELRVDATALGVADRVISLVGPSHELLEALYNGATALVFPSKFEGFGWPVIEAQACGCPVLCGEGGALAEVAGDGAFVRPAADENAFVSELRRIVRDPAAGAAWATAGRHNAACYTQEEMLRRYEALYQELTGIADPSAGQTTPEPVPAVGSPS
jgi:glycosyltransferase involved in cell wall biosynthesis